MLEKQQKYKKGKKVHAVFNQVRFMGNITVIKKKIHTR
jgi:hypothetical protein